MENEDHQYWISYLVADHISFVHEDLNYFISSPSRENKFLAEEIFLEYYRRGLEFCLNEDDINKLLRKKRIWNQDKEKKLKEAIEEMDDIKVKMYECFLNGELVGKLRISLAKTNKLIEELASQKSSFDQYSAKSLAAYAKQNFLLGCSIYKGKNRPYWKLPHKCFLLSDSILPAAYSILSKYHLTDTDYRELARGSTWRSLWNVRKNTNIFGRPLVDLTAGQKNILAWSHLYDNVYSHSNCPPDEVIEDDDILDGWMISQKRKRELEAGKNEIRSKINPKIANSDEVFILMGDDSTIGRDKFNIVYEMNDIQGKMAFKRRMAQIKKEGVVPEISMLETQEQLRMQIAKGTK